MQKTLYDYLQVTPDASDVVIRAAHRSLLQRYHPDKNPGDPNAENLCKILNGAYSVLSDPAKRRAYDLKLEEERFREHSARAQAKPTSTSASTSGRSGGRSSQVQSSPTGARPNTQPYAKSPPPLDPVDQRWEELRPLYRAAIAGKCTDRLIPADVLGDFSRPFLLAGWMGYLAGLAVLGYALFSGALDNDSMMGAFGIALLAVSVFTVSGHFVPNGRLIQQSRATYYYLKVFRQLHDRKKIWKDTGWWEMFIPALWLPYRRVYGLAVVYFSGLLALDFLEHYGIFKQPAAAFYLAIGVGVVSNKAYFQSVSSQVRMQLHATPDHSEATKVLSAKGGPRMWIAAVVFGTYAFGSQIVLEYLPTPVGMKVTANNSAKATVPVAAQSPPSRPPQVTRTTNPSTKTVSASDAEQARFTRAVEFLVGNYPELDERSKQYRKLVVDEILKAKESYESSGSGSADALIHAARDVGYTVPDNR